MTVDSTKVPTLQDIEDSKLAMDDIQSITYSPTGSFVDAKGVTRKTINGLVDPVDAAANQGLIDIADDVDAVNAAADGFDAVAIDRLNDLDAAYVFTAINNGVWAEFETFTSLNQYMVFTGGTAYKPKNSTTLPYIVGASPDTNFVEVVANLSTAQGDDRYEHNVDDTTAFVSLSPLVGESVKTRGYGSAGGVGGACYLVVSVADVAREFIPFADHVFFNGNIARLMPDNLASIPAEQCGVTYGGVGVIETAQLQAAVNLANEIRLKTQDTDSGAEVQVNGYIRIDDTITRPTGRITFKGVNAARSRIIWSGGFSAKTMLDLGSSSWGGLEDVRVQGFDQHDGQTAKVDGCQHLLSLTFTDLLFGLKGVQFISGHGDLFLLDIDSGENAITNLIFHDSFITNKGNGYIVKTKAAEGGKRHIGFYGGTITSTSNTAGGIVDVSDMSTGFAVNIFGSRIEYVDPPVDHVDWCFVKTNNATNVHHSRTTVLLSGVVGFINGVSNNYAVARANKKGSVVLTMSGCNISGLSGIRYLDGSEEHPDFLTESAVVTEGMKVSSMVYGNSALLSGNFADRLSNESNHLVKYGDIVNCDDGVCDYMVPNIAEGDTTFYSFSSTGFNNIGKILALNASSATATLDLSDTANAFLRKNVNVRIAGAGVAAGDLDTVVLSIDGAAGTVTFTDAASTSVTDVSLITINAGWILGFRKPRAILPADLNTDSSGSSVYVNDIGTRVTWDGTRWMYGSDYAVTTGNRPIYVNSLANRGLSVFDTDLGHSISWTGTVWVDGVGTTV